LTRSIFFTVTRHRRNQSKGNNPMMISNPVMNSDRAIISILPNRMHRLHKNRRALWYNIST
jgi:hypothetical protein